MTGWTYSSWGRADWRRWNTVVSRPSWSGWSPTEWGGDSSGGRRTSWEELGGTVLLVCYQRLPRKALIAESGEFFYPCWMPFLDQINHRREVFNKFQVFKTFTRLFQYHLVAQNFLYRIMYFIKILRIIWKNGKLIKLSRHFRAGSVVECGAAARSGKSESADSS